MAVAALRICRRCGKVTRGSCRCVVVLDHRANGVNRKRYFTARWSRLRAQILARDRHLCQACLRFGVTRAGDQVDHIANAELNPELFWSAGNLQTLCRTCHSQKTRRSDREVVARVGGSES